MRKLLDGDSHVGAMSNLKQARKSARPTFFFFFAPGANDEGDHSERARASATNT